MSGLPDPEALLRDTDWARLYTVRGYADEDVPAALVTLLDPDPAAQAKALERVLESVTDQGVMYPPVVPVAQYVAAILADPRTTAVGSYEWSGTGTRQRSLRAELLDWLGRLARSSDDAAARLHANRNSFDPPHPDLDLLRGLRPVFYTAVAAFLYDGDADVRHAALIAAIPLAEAPELARRRDKLAACAHRLLVTCTDGRYRAQALDALDAWGHDVQDLQTPDDIRERVELANNGVVGDPWAVG
ncbi:hypothetical protein [Embleya sp. NPDC001921]